jgi:D-Tyr-tRNAtyr deacylase
MRRNFIRYVSVGTVVVALAAAIGVSAFAASSNRGHQFGPRGGLTIHGFGPGFGFRFGFPGGPGLGVRAGGGGVTYADVLTPAADYLGVSLSTLQSDLKGGKTLAQEATAKGKTASDLVDAIVKAETKVLDAQKAAGWLTDAQETALLDNFKSQVTQLVNNGPGVPPVGVKNGGPLQTAADYLGISVSDLVADLKGGKTLAQEATAKGKTVDGLVKAMLAPLQTRLDKSVSSGDITAAQETAILNRATTALTNLVNNTKPGKMQAGLRQAGLRLALPRLFALHR